MRCRRPHASATINGCHSGVETIRPERFMSRCDAIARKLTITSSRYEIRGIEYHQTNITHITPQQVIIKASGRLSLRPASQITTIDRRGTRRGEQIFFCSKFDDSTTPIEPYPTLSTQWRHLPNSSPMSTLRLSRQIVLLTIRPSSRTVAHQMFHQLLTYRPT
jgi:hypothetical protein